MKRFIISACAGMLVAEPAFAGEKIVQPVQVGAETAHFNHGLATVTLVGHNGSVQFRPAPMDHGSVAVDVAVFNASNEPSNIDIGDVSAVANGATLRAFTVTDLQKKAKTRAAWTQVALAFAGGISAGVAASQRDSYHATAYTPHGRYSTFVSRPSTAGQVEAAAITAGTAYSMTKVQQLLDQTLDSLADNVLQLTTVDPGDSYGGRVVFEKFNAKALPTPVTLTVKWNGEEYHFGLQLANEGTTAPKFTNIAVGGEFGASPPAAAPVEAKAATVNGS